MLSVVLIPLALAPWLVPQVAKELASPLFRDSVQSQYSGWCLRHGVKLYRDVGAPDGPLIHFLHAFIQIFAGISDRGCRIADLIIQVTGAAAMGALLAPRSSASRVAAVLQRIAWALMAVTLWLTWYLSQGWTQTVQRDGYYALLGYLGLVIVYASATLSPRSATFGVSAGVALCTLVVFSRQPGIIFPASAVLGLLVFPNPPGARAHWRWKAAMAGAGAAVAVVVLGILFFGSFRGLWFWYIKFPFTFYRWLARQSPWHLLAENYADAGLLAALILVGVVLAIVVRLLPPRAIMFAFPPILFLAAACLQGKGWPNHVQQTTAALVPLCVLVVSELWSHNADRARWSPVQAVAAVALLLVVLYQAHQTLLQSPFYGMQYPPPIDRDIADAEIVGNFIRAHTAHDDTVFLYGHEAHVLLNAERRPAVPYYVNILFNTEVLYEREPASPGEGPSPRERETMRRLQSEIAADACQRLTSRPPGAMAFLESSLGIFGEGVGEVSELCPALPALLKSRYREVVVPGTSRYHVYLRQAG